MCKVARWITEISSLNSILTDSKQSGSAPGFLPECFLNAVAPHGSGGFSCFFLDCAKHFEMPFGSDIALLQIKVD